MLLDYIPSGSDFLIVIIIIKILSFIYTDYGKVNTDGASSDNKNKKLTIPEQPEKLSASTIMIIVFVYFPLIILFGVIFIYK
jgi:preprotein translocase subunit SecE